MKNNKNNMDLERLLSDVEHAGRDACRRDQLAAMIDDMAAAETPKHGFWWWSARVAAAACVLFFVTTAVRIWFIPTTQQGPLMADAGVEIGKWEVESVDSTVAIPVKPAAPRRVAPRNHTAQVDVVVVEEPRPIDVEEELLPVVEELLVEEIEATEEPLEAVEEARNYTVDDIVTPVVSVAYTESQAPTQEQPRRRSTLKDFFRQSDPDDMTGTVLAFRIL